MPAVARGDQNGVDIIPLEDVIHFAIELAITISIVLVDHLFYTFSTGAL
jgi:hypothetical protein